MSARVSKIPDSTALTRTRLLQPIAPGQSACLPGSSPFDPHLGDRTGMRVRRPR